VSLIGHDHGVDPISRDRRRCSFGSAAEEYERFRPGYPAEAVEWLAGRPSRRVLDLGAGTGKLTRALVAAGHEVVAVEPDEAMRAVLAAALPAVDVLAGVAEAIPLAAASVDEVVVGHAFHWFDERPALAEIARVLRPAGRLGVVYNNRDESVAWVAELSRILHSISASAAAAEGDERFGPLFEPIERAEFAYVQDLDSDGLVGLAGSASHTITLPPEERAALLGNVAALARTQADETGRLRLPYVAVCLRARLAG
jgi:SAM-dependent methyltransferase